MAISMQIPLDIYFYYFWCRAVMVWLRPPCSLKRSLNAAAFNDISVNKKGRTLSRFNMTVPMCMRKKWLFPIWCGLDRTLTSTPRSTFEMNLNAVRPSLNL